MNASQPGEVLKFQNYLPIKLNYRNTLTYKNTKKYDKAAMTKGHVWHQVLIKHRTPPRDEIDRREALRSVFEAVQGQEFFPVAFRKTAFHASEDRFLVRQCPDALEKLFNQNLRIGLSISLEIQLNVAVYEVGQISPAGAIGAALQLAYQKMDRTKDGVLDLTDFASNPKLDDILVNLGNRAVFQYVCDMICRNEAVYCKIQSVLLSNNSLCTLAPLQAFAGIEFRVLDLRNNWLSSSKRLCRDIKDIKAHEILLADNPLTKWSNYPKCLDFILKNFALVDGIPSEKLSKNYTPMDYEVDTGCDGHRIDSFNPKDLLRFTDSPDWHGVIIPDVPHEFTKEEILDYFFANTSNELSEIYPCYYKFENGEHQFLVRDCFDQLEYLTSSCGMAFQIPCVAPPPSAGPGYDPLQTPLMSSNRSIHFHYRMCIGDFVAGQVEPSVWIAKAVERRFNVIDRVLDLKDFQNTEGLENIVVNVGTPKVLERILFKASRQFLTNCVEMHLSQNKIMVIPSVQCLGLMKNLKALDLGDNWIYDLDAIKELRALGLKSLRLDGNPVCAQYTQPREYVRAVRELFPTVAILDGVDIATKDGLRTQRNFLCNLEGYDFVEQFVTQYFQTLQTNAIAVKDFYHSSGIFSMTVSYAAKKLNGGNYKRLAPYLEHARNLKQLFDVRRITNGYAVGPDEIMRILLSLPQLQFDCFSFSVDAPIFNEDMAVVTVHGNFRDGALSAMDADILMAFTRTFVLRPVKRGLGFLRCSVAYKIVNDQFNIYTPTPKQVTTSFKYVRDEKCAESEIVTLPEKEALLVMLQEVTGLKIIWSARCLEDANWKFEDALLLFLDMAQKNEIPETAFNELSA